MVSYVATAVVAISVLASAPQPLEWQTDYGKALAATRADDQPLLVVLDKPEAAEARMEPALLSEGAASGEEAEVLRPYHLCHVDVSSEYGQKVAEAFKADSFPFTAIIDKTGSVIVFSKAGKIAANEWEQVLNKHQNGDKSSATTHVSYKVIGESSGSSSPAYSNPSYCPSCQRRSM